MFAVATTVRHKMGLEGHVRTLCVFLGFVAALFLVMGWGKRDGYCFVSFQRLASFLALYLCCSPSLLCSVARCAVMMLLLESR